MNSITHFFSQYGIEMLISTREHILLTVIAMLIATATAVPLGILLAGSRNRVLTGVVMGMANIIQPIPSLAFVALTVVIFHLVNELLDIQFLATLGAVPATVALIAYALLPILRNTYTGIQQVDPAVIEVAKGMGMTWYQVLISVQLPMALPVIMAGIRISTVWTVGVATLVSLVGAGGLGDLIFRGLSNYRINLILAGSVPAAILALLLDWLLTQVEIVLTPRGLREEKERQQS